MPRAALSNDVRSSGRLSGAAFRFASPAVRAVLRRRMNELAGVLVALAAVALLVALATHNPSDPSLNTATDRAPSNLAGHPGAIIADLLLQTFGFAAALMSMERDLPPAKFVS